ncbi:MAG: HypC/HybG/HupF family hydrogenase formation chaperone [Candidatus Thiodiazotropha sp. (ex Ustalcina ferruginea)]|nr:HypC/HybG/HupF family hydrogenase formation chaperone [Candidatus Thiodiazotropha sp. (ex Ustalcina ferruginea)]
MCIGVPMRVISTMPGFAVCTGLGGQRRVDTLLVGDQPVGNWLLVFLDAAREVLTEEQASRIRQALDALGLAFRGETYVDHLFADLVDREPQLPLHLRAPK